VSAPRCSTFVRSAFRLAGLLRAAGFGLSLLFALAACKPGVGSSCDKGEARCIDHERELSCQNGKFIESPCRGPAGCATSERGTNCDITRDRPGDGCSTDDEGAATCVGNASLLACHGGAYTVMPCRGAKGCANEDGRAFCDTSLANPGDLCRDEGLKACASDGKQVLWCKGHVMAALYPCGGENGCASNAGKLACDTSIAKLGDACDKSMDGRAFSCTEDASAILVCKGGAFAPDEKCKSGQKCVVDGTSTRCAKPDKK
jgi:hypothetical protein